MYRVLWDAPLEMEARQDLQFAVRIALPGLKGSHVSTVEMNRLRAFRV
jgi:hypothetical protein